MSLPTHDELLESAHEWLRIAGNTESREVANTYAAMSLAASNLAREIRKRPPDQWQVWGSGKEPVIPEGFEVVGPWEPFAMTEDGYSMERRPLRKVLA